ncbi:MAG: dihydrolipoyl dehydrogenase [Thermoplasmatota archaeon]
MTIREVDVLVVGAGIGGYPAAIRAAQLGKKVTIVEKDKLGGVCLNVGCIPSKALIHAASVVRTSREASAMGISVGDVKVDAKQLQVWKRGIVESLTSGVGQLLRANKVEQLFGTATFAGPDTVVIKAKDGGEQTLRFQSCVLATGSRPVEIPGFKFDGRSVIDSTGALDLDEIPKDLVVIGGGFIGLEIGSVFRTLGSNVAVVEMLDQLLPGQDPDLVRVVERHLKKDGVKIFTKAKAKGFAGGAAAGGSTAEDRAGSVGGGIVEVDVGDGKIEKLAASKVLVSVGRRPNTENLGLDKAGVTLDAKGYVKVDEQLRTSNAKVFAIGDIVPGPALAHKASKEGTIVAAIIAGAEHERVDYRALPWAVFTEPEIATVGLTEDQAKAQGFTTKTGRFPFAASGRAKSTNAADGFVKLIVDAKTDVVLGCHIVGPEASNLIAEAALAIEMGATAEDIALTIHTHPTLPEALMEAAENVHGKSIHAANR